jgi:hypothetical protein
VGAACGEASTWVMFGHSVVYYMWGMATFVITLRAKGDSIRTLRAALKLLLRCFGLRAFKVEQTSD